MYTKFDPEELILRDHLAVDRTMLANERTLLSFLRTSIFLLVSSITFLRVFEGELLMIITSYILIAFSIVSGIVGVVRFRRMKRKINSVYKTIDDPT
ncbi:MAG: DUF202 domain-containing protein [Candidatus Paceibacterota bacterium]